MDFRKSQKAIAISGAVLAGGRSSRFGTDKALHSWQGKTLLEAALQSFDQYQDVFIVGGKPEYAQFARVIPDTQPFAGALHGIATALEVALHPRVCITACDMPNLSSAYWQYLETFNAEVVIPENQHGQLEPLAAIYNKQLLAHAQNAIARDNFKLSTWFQGAEIQIVSWANLEPRFSSQIFLNANYLEDLVVNVPT